MIVVRVAEPGGPAFQLRKGEEGISVFNPAAVDPPVTEEEIFDASRPGSAVVARTEDEIAAKGLLVVPIDGADVLPERLRQSHAEIRPSAGMPRPDFKKALKELE